MQQFPKFKDSMKNPIMTSLKLTFQLLEGKCFLKTWGNKTPGEMLKNYQKYQNQKNQRLARNAEIVIKTLKEYIANQHKILDYSDLKKKDKQNEC